MVESDYYKYTTQHYITAQRRPAIALGGSRFGQFDAKVYGNSLYVNWRATYYIFLYMLIAEETHLNNLNMYFSVAKYSQAMSICQYISVRFFNILPLFWQLSGLARYSIKCKCKTQKTYFDLRLYVRNLMLGLHPITTVNALWHIG